jgi:hypothetical protein
MALVGCGPTSTAVPGDASTLTPDASDGTTQSLPAALPVEVTAGNGVIQSLTLNVPPTDLTGSIQLWMQVHNFKYQDMLSVQVNGSAWISLDDQTVTLQGLAAQYGGIGGGYSTLKLTVNLPPGTVVVGVNTVSFRFNRSDGRSTAFRVLDFSFQNDVTTIAQASAQYAVVDPSTWTPPMNDPTNIAAGKTLWYSAPLVNTMGAGILAHCTSCHTQDGRDLKYFNYSNQTIESRAMFHGLTASQGAQIASYIRSLDTPAPAAARPWNPPYQPGPGLDSQPVENWAAGAGLGAVMEDDASMLSAMFPSSITISASANLNVRETPVDFQLPDWNRWLPGTHPLDATATFNAVLGFQGYDFATSNYNTLYSGGTLQGTDGNGHPASIPFAGIPTLLSNGASYADVWSVFCPAPSSKTNQPGNMCDWISAQGSGYGNTSALETYLGAQPTSNPGSYYDAPLVDGVYSLALWGLVKNWEIMQQFQLEGSASSILTPSFYQSHGVNGAAEPRSWMSDHAFMIAPHQLHMNQTTGMPGLLNGSREADTYITFAWYHLQIILNNSNKFYSYQHPVDWGYTYSTINNPNLSMAKMAHGSALQMLWMIKAMQVTNNGLGPESEGSGWSFNAADISQLVATGAFLWQWPQTSQQNQVALLTAYVTAWLANVQQFTPAQFYAGGQASATDTLTSYDNGAAGVDTVPMIDRVWLSIPRLRYLGVAQSLINELAAWAATLWPKFDWTLAANATCTPPNMSGYVKCSQ